MIEKEEVKLYYYSDIENDIVIDDGLRDLWGDLTEIEFENLKKDIIEAKKCHVPLIFWEKDDKLILIDGHNRLAICKKHNIPFQFEVIEFEDKKAAKKYIYDKQKSRRNAKLYQDIVNTIELEGEAIKELAKENQKLSQGRGKKGEQKVVYLKALNEIGKKAGCSSEYVRQAMRLQEIIKPDNTDLKTRLWNGEISINKAYSEIKKKNQPPENNKKDDKKKNGNFKTYAELIDVSLKYKEYQTALYCCEKCIKLKPDDPELLKKKEDILKKLNSTKDDSVKVKPEKKEPEKKVTVETISHSSVIKEVTEDEINKKYAECLKHCPEISQLQEKKNKLQEQYFKYVIEMMLRDMGMRELAREIEDKEKKDHQGNMSKCYKILRDTDILKKLIDAKILPEYVMQKGGRRKK